MKTSPIGLFFTQTSEGMPSSLIAFLPMGDRTLIIFPKKEFASLMRKPGFYLVEIILPQDEMKIGLAIPVLNDKILEASRDLVDLYLTTPQMNHERGQNPPIAIFFEEARDDSQNDFVGQLPMGDGILDIYPDIEFAEHMEEPGYYLVDITMMPDPNNPVGLASLDFSERLVRASQDLMTFFLDRKLKKA